LIDKKFQNDSKTQSAVLMQFQIIGELSKKIDRQIKDKIDLPWKERFSGAGNRTQACV